MKRTRLIDYHQISPSRLAHSRSANTQITLARLNWSTNYNQTTKITEFEDVISRKRGRDTHKSMCVYCVYIVYVLCMYRMDGIREGGDVEMLPNKQLQQSCCFCTRCVADLRCEHIIKANHKSSNHYVCVCE